MLTHIEFLPSVNFFVCFIIAVMDESFLTLLKHSEMVSIMYFTMTVHAESFPTLLPCIGFSIFLDTKGFSPM